MVALNRFQEVQGLSARRENESFERVRAILSCRQKISEWPFTDSYVPASTDGQSQQQRILPVEQEIDMKALRERNEQVRELEIQNSNIS